MSLEREFADEASARSAMLKGLIDFESGMTIRFKEITAVEVVDYAQRKLDRHVLEQADMQRESEAQAKIQSMVESRVNGSLTIQGALLPFVGGGVGINLLSADKFDHATLTGVQFDHFTAQNKDLEISVPYNQILKIIRAPSGRVDLGAFKGSYPLVIHIFDLVVYKGAVGVGFSVPMSDF
jgi:hypothetical protein